MKTLLILLLCLFLVGILKADELPIGKKYISHETQIVNKDIFGDYIFLTAVKDLSGSSMFESCVLFKNNATCGSTIFAVKKTDYDSAALDVSGITDYSEQCRKIDGYIRNNKNFILLIDVECSRVSNKNTPYDKVIEKYEIEKIVDNKAVVKRVKTLYLDYNDNIIEEKTGLNQQLDIQKGNYAYFTIPVLSIIFITAIIVIRKERKA